MDRLGLAAFGTAGLGDGRPGKNVEMNVSLGALDKALEEQGGGERAGETGFTGIIELGNR